MAGFPDSSDRNLVQSHTSWLGRLRSSCSKNTTMPPFMLLNVKNHIRRYIMEWRISMISSPIIAMRITTPSSSFTTASSFDCTDDLDL